MLLRGTGGGAGGVYAARGERIVATVPLDDLLRLVETLRARIDAHGPALRNSEALTRYALIDPLLRELGWDTSDPTQVVPEYPTSGGRADYSLLADGQPRMMVEAKKLGEPMAGAISQGINYCLEKGTLYFSVTDGQRWELYETHKPVPIEQKQIVRFDMLGSPADVCLKALALWRPGVLAGQVRVAETPVAALAGKTATPTPAPTPTSPPVPPRQPSPQAPSTAVAVAGEWLSLASLTPEGGSKPAEIAFPTGERVAATTWADFMATLVGWLENEGHLSQADAPIQYGKMNILATSPNHPNGRAFKHRRQTRLFHINTNYSGLDNVRNARLIVERAGQDSAQFRVRLRD